MKFRSYKSGSSGNVNLLSSGEHQLLIDAGKPWVWIKKAMDFKTSNLSGILIDHQHNDHSFSMLMAARSGIDVYALPETLEFKGLSGHRFHPIELKKTFSVGAFKVMAFPLVHDVPCCGFLIKINGEKMVHITDTAYCPFKFHGLNIIAVECNYSLEILSASVRNGVISAEHKNRIIQTHFGLNNVLDFLAANDLSAVREIHLLHLSDTNSDAYQCKKAVQAATGKRVVVAGEAV